MKMDEPATHHAALEVEPPRPEAPAKTGRLILIAIVAVLVIAAVVAAGILPRVKARQAVRAETEQLAVPTVTLFRVHPSSAEREIVLPANIQPFIAAPIFARTSGYLKAWYTDIGARVRKGQLLAEIETPEVDAQLRQARADLSTSEANLHLSEITAARYENLLKTDAVSKQETDSAVSDLAAKRAIVQSNQQNVKRLEELVSFEKVFAPFEGVITARNTDVGQLINSGSAGGPTTELFRIAAVNTLRVYVNVPQIYSTAVRRGMTVDLTLPQFPGRPFRGTVVRNADAIDPASRTLLVEVDVSNPSGDLLSGAYAEAHFKLPGSIHSLILPVTALIFRSEGLEVATVDSQQRAVLKHIRIGTDLGNQVEVAGGLNDGDQVIVNPPDSLVTGELVRPAEPEPEQGREQGQKPEQQPEEKQAEKPDKENQR